MFELVICRRQVVREGEDTKLLLDRFKLRFWQLLWVRKLCLNSTVYLQGIFISEPAQMFIIVCKQNSTLLIWRALQIDPDMWEKIMSVLCLRRKQEKKRLIFNHWSAGARSIQPFFSKAFRMKEMMTWLSIKHFKTAVIGLKKWSRERGETTIELIRLPASSSNGKKKIKLFNNQIKTCYISTPLHKLTASIHH